MRKFYDVYKEKQTKSIELIEGKVLDDFKCIYSALQTKYDISDFYALNEEEQVTFLAEMNSYWNEKEGTSERGKKFLLTRSDVLSENSTSLQKKNYLKNKTSVIISETLRQSDLKWKIYDIIDEIYSETQAKAISDILSPDLISEIVNESFKVSLDNFVNEIKTELNESEKEVELNEKKNDKKIDPDAKIRNKGNVVFPAESKSVKDKKDHFPLNDEGQAKNALARVHQYKSVPPWYTGSLETLISKVTSAVHKKYKDIKISK